MAYVMTTGLRERTMGWFTSDIKTIEDLFMHSLQDIYYAEHQIEKALPEMIAKASDGELKKGFRTHLKQTKGKIKRLNQAFKKLKTKPEGTKCPAIDGIIEETNEIAGEVDDKMVLNAALIAAVQAVEHYLLRHAVGLGDCLAAATLRGSSLPTSRRKRRLTRSSTVSPSARSTGRRRRGASPARTKLNGSRTHC